MKKKQKLILTISLLFYLTMGYSQDWQIVWQDEFNNGISSDWVFETGNGGWGNNELQYYRQENATVSNGKLIITAKREAFGGSNYTSARLKTQGKKSWKYGKIEASIAMPSFQGIWPAFWMLGDNISSVGWPKCGEIDIMEHVNTGGEVVGTIHWDANGHASYGGNTSTNITAFHTYSVEWDENSIKWFIDGAKFHEVNIAGNVNSTDELHNNFFILLNLAVGGDWPGSNIDNNGFPAQMQVEYVRVYQKGANPPSVSPSTDVITAYKDCNYTGFSGGLTIGDYNLARLKTLGIQDDAISSLKIAQGFQAILYQDDNFGGASTVINADNSCLNATWNDKVTSIRIIANGTTTLGNQTFYLQNRNSGLNMDVWNASLANGANIAQGTVNTTNNQKFTLTHLGDGLYKIIANHSGQSLDVNNFNKANGANVEQYPYNGTVNQQFVLVSTGDGFYKIVARHSGRIVEVAGASTANGANVQQWDNNNQTCGQWKLVPVTTSQTSVLIQAESYSTMSGIQVEATTDTGGGSNVGYADTGDWMAYNNINFPTSGSYTIEYRVASAVTGAKISSDLSAGTIQLGSLDVPNTGGWQNWQTISHTVNVNAGTYNFGLFIQNTGVNLNWIRITKSASALTAKEVSSKTAVVTEIPSLSIYPNPTENTLFFNAEVSGANVSVINESGATVSLQKASNNSIDVSGLKTGVYLILVEKDGIKTVRRFIKK
ncbi:RICIN domain-containing protein [Flavobacterium sp.]|uniref:RICIN domain-containing protein n=1 Tax=Flavobacterium sp. TaxID=239 RepID=UPI0032649E4E